MTKLILIDKPDEWEKGTAQRIMKQIIWGSEINQASCDEDLKEEKIRHEMEMENVEDIQAEMKHYNNEEE